MNEQLIVYVSRRRLKKALWIKACRHDGIDSTEKFVVFSDDNSHIKRLNAMGA